MTAAGPRVVHLNVSDGGVPKRPVARAAIGPLGVAGDRQANTEAHGGPERALCLYSLERIEALRAEGHSIGPGDAGENVTVAGLDWDAVVPGARLRLGAEVLVEITRYTSPCRKIAASFADGDSARISQQRHPGWSRVYARVLAGGELAPGDPVEPLPVADA